MRDLQNRLHEGVGGIEPAWNAPEDVLRTVHRRGRLARLRAAVVATAIAVAAVTGTVTALRENPPSPSTTATAPIDVDALELAWRADIGPIALGQSLLADTQRLYVLDDEGVASYPKDCTDPCAPEWRAPIPRDANANANAIASLAVGDGVVFVTNGSSVFAFESDCATDGATCAPLWEGAPPPGASSVDGPVASGRLVRVTYTLKGEGNRNRVFAAGFSADGCEAGHECLPEWTVDLGSGVRYIPGTSVGGVFYQQVGDYLTGVGPSGCQASADGCEPLFRVEALGDERTQAGSLYGPVAAGEELIVASGDGNVYAFQPGCGTSCEPLWFGRASDYIEGQPVVAGGVVAVVVKSEVVAFPIGCRDDGGECDAAWWAPIDDYGTIAHADADHVVLVDHQARPNSIQVFPSDCRLTCAPLWKTGLPGEAQGVTSDGEHVFVGAQGGALTAYPLLCSGACTPSWTTTVDGRDVWNLVIDSQGLYVVASSSEPYPQALEGAPGSLYGFRVAGV